MPHPRPLSDCLSCLLALSYPSWPPCYSLKHAPAQNVISVRGVGGLGFAH